MAKIVPTKPSLILLYGYPGAGKTFFARQFTDAVQAAHVQDERIRSELFREPKFDKQENSIVSHLMDYMAEEFLDSGLSVVYDTNAMRAIQRHNLRQLARRSKAQTLTIWFQVDADTAWLRASKRDRRRSDDRYAAEMTQERFKSIQSGMQNPMNTEDYVVVSGKHTFNTQYSAVARAMREHGLLEFGQDAARAPKPGMFNFVPDAHKGRVDQSRRNITIR